MSSSESDVDYGTSVTKVVLDEHTKGVAQLIQNKYSSVLTSRHLLTNQEVLREIRRDLIESLPQYSLKERSASSYPDFFVLTLLVISQIHTINVVDDLLNDLYKFSLFGMNREDDLPNMQYCCACSHLCKPENLYIIENTETNLRIIIGCDCAKKKELISKEEAKELKDQSKEDPNYRRFQEITDRKNEERKQQREAKKREEERMRQEEEATRLREERERTHRECPTCNELNVPFDDKYYPTKTCVPCWIKKKNASAKCNKCGESSDGKPLCLSCWRKDMKCESCGKESNGRSLCNACWSSKNRKRNHRR